MPANENNIHIMYSMMLTSGASHAVTAEMQRRIYEYAVSVRDTALLTKLVEYSGLVKEIDNLLAKRTELDVLVAWACRKDRSTAELEKRLLKEKRVSALLPLASSTGLEQRVYTTIARISSIQLCQALASNPSLNNDLRKSKLVEFAKHIPRGGYTQHGSTLTKMIETGTTMETQASFYEAIALSSNVAPYLMACLDSKTLPASAVDVILSKTERIYGVSKDKLESQTSKFFQTLAVYPLSLAQQQVLLKSIEVIAGHVGKSWHGRVYQDILEKLQNHDSDYETEFASFVSCCDPKESFALLESLEYTLKSLGASSSQGSSIRHDQTARLVRAVAQHAYLPWVVVLKYVSAMGSSEVDMVRSRLERNEDTDGLLDLLDVVNSPDMLLRTLKNEDTVVRAYVSRRAKKDLENPAWLSLSASMLNDPVLAYTSLPYPQLLRCMSRSQSLRVLVESEMTKSLTSEDAWNVFYVLAKDFSGTLPRLLEASVKLV